jgi:twitching motility two-component system response regulator PilH
VALVRDQPTSETPPLILIADDNVDTREMYALFLPTVGYRVETAADGHEAILRARTMHPDLIVMDLTMPKLDGWAAIRELQGRAMTAAIPVIVLTGHDFKAYLKHSALAEGAASYLMKPCFPDQLAREVSAHLTSRRNRAVGAL